MVDSERSDFECEMPFIFAQIKVTDSNQPSAIDVYALLGT